MLRFKMKQNKAVRQILALTILGDYFTLSQPISILPP